jgi:hypothetical protein
MPTYLVEAYMPRSHAQEARAIGRRARATAEELSREGVPIRYVRTTLLPDDETCFHLFEAPGPAAVEEVNRRAALGCARIVGAIEASGRASDEDTMSVLKWAGRGNARLPRRPLRLSHARRHVGRLRDAVDVRLAGQCLVAGTMVSLLYVWTAMMVVTIMGAGPRDSWFWGILVAAALGTALVFYVYEHWERAYWRRNRHRLPDHADPPPWK